VNPTIFLLITYIINSRLALPAGTRVVDPAGED
jgi:hypothetical protein